MKDTAGLGGIEHAINSDKAVSLAIAGKRLRNALDLLAEFDAAPPPGNKRELLLNDAGEALWAYVVQKELLNLTDHELINKVFKVPAEVWRVMGLHQKKQR